MVHWVKVGGLPLPDHVVVSDFSFETWADGGCGQASFVVSDSLMGAGRLLVPGAGIEVMRGALPVYAGIVDDFDPTSGAVACIGLAADAANYIALDSLGNTTRDTDTATLVAAGRGWGVVNRSGTFGTVSGDDTNPQSLSALLTAYAEQTGQRWGVDANSRVFMRADPPAPRWFIAPGAVALGGSSEGAISHYVVVYFDGTLNQKVIIAHPKAHMMLRREETLDLTQDGTMGLMEATAAAGGRHALVAAGLAWSTGATVSADQLTTVGDTPADLPSVRAGQVVRIFATAVGSSITPTLWVDAVIGKTKYDTREPGRIYLEPSNTAPRTAVAVWAK